MTRTRHTADTITDDALDHLYRQLATLHRRTETAEVRAAELEKATARAEKAERAANISDAVTTQTKQLLARRTETLRARAEAAEAAINRVRGTIQQLCEPEPHPGHDHLCPDDIQRAIEDALDEQPKDQP
ncbi:hypothetical protein [Streptomyces sp. NPDC047315]|uniref:hypothetical protein n=1 Tax=Streptomyces sp. NPDC047315 TaxID=3155142 RepID=UPI0033F10CAE